MEQKRLYNIEIDFYEALALDYCCPELDGYTLMCIGVVIRGEEPSTIDFTEQEVWYIREKVPWNYRVGDNSCGLTIKKKIYAAIWSIVTTKMYGNLSDMPKMGLRVIDPRILFFDVEERHATENSNTSKDRTED